MAQDRITEVFDIPQIEKNANDALNAVKGILPELKKLGDEIKSNTSISGSSNNANAASAELKELTSLVRDYVDAKKQQSAAQKAAAESRKSDIESAKAEKELTKQIALDRKLEMANAKEVLALKKEIAKQEADLRKLDIAGSKEALAIEKEIAKQKADLAKAEAAEQKAQSKAIADNRKLDIASAKESLAIQKELEKQQKATIDAQKKEAAELKVAEKNIVSLNRAEAQLIQQIKAAEAAYKQSYLTLGAQAKETIYLKDKTNELKATQNSMNTAIGNYRSNVGNYSSAWNGLGNSINQVARELPNFAQSAQLGFLAISNNLPILADEIGNARNKIAELKAEGKDAPSLFKQIGASIFSWQTLMVVGITLLVKYGAEISDWAMSVSDAEKAVKSYNKALEESIKSESEGISKLYSLKSALADTTNARSSDLAAFNAVKKEYPEYFDYLDTEKASLSELNSIIDAQIKARIDNAKQIALQKVAAEATEAYVKAQMSLNEEVGFWSKIAPTSRINTKDLTDETKKLAIAYELLYKEGKVTFDELVVYEKRIKSISDAEKQMTLSTNAATKSINQLKNAVNSFNEDSLIALENEVIKYKDGTKERYDAEEKFINQKKDIKIKELQQEFNGNALLLAGNKKYQAEKLNIELKAQREIDALREGAAKKNKPKREVAEKYTLEKEAIAAQKAIAENEEMTFDQRYDAAVKFSELSQDLLKKQGKSTIDNLIITATDTDKLLKKINDDKEKLRLADLKRQEDYSKELARIILDQLNNVQENQNEAREKELSALSEDLATRKISLQQYNNQKLTINDKYDGIILQNQKDALRAYLDELKASGDLQEDEVAKIEEKITDLTNKQSENRINKVEDDAKKRKELKDREFEYEKQIAQELQNFIFQMLDARTEKEIAELEKSKERLSEEYELKNSAVEQASISDEEKAARKAVLLAEEAEQQKTIDNEIRKIKRKQAIYDKAQALVTIAINTAIAASSPTNLALGGALTPLIIGLGAAQAAIVLATPLPEYAKGKKASDSYEGMAIAGEKGTEMKIDKDGKIQLLTEPTLIHTKRGDTILSNEQLRKGDLGKHIKSDSEKANYDELIRAFGYNISMLRKDVKNSGNNIIIDNSNYNLNIQKARA